MPWLQGLSSEFLRAISPTIRAAWQLAAGNDMRFEGAVSNEPQQGVGVMRALEGAMFGYMTRIFKLAASDPLVREAGCLLPSRQA